jgi:DNA-binding FadR family transcriptional regulator
VGELYSARAVVESGAAAVLARRVAEGTVSKNELAALQAVLDELDALAWSHGRSTGAADFATALRRRDLDLDFHLGLVELVGNDFVTGVEHSLLAPLRAYPTLWREENAIASWQQEHRAILQAVRDGNAETAPGHVLYHLEKGRQRMNDEVIDEGANVHAAPRPTTTIGNLRTSLGREAAHVPDKSGT